MLVRGAQTFRVSVRKKELEESLSKFGCFWLFLVGIVGCPRVRN